MFARIKKVKSGDTEYQYVQIVEAYRDKGRPRQRVVVSLGRLDLLGDKLDHLVSSLRKYCRKQFTLPEEMTCKQALPWGAVLLTRHLWEQVNLSEIIGQFCRSPRKRCQVAEMAFVLVANRLCQPRSEHGLARWLEHTFVCDRRGRRWEPEWLPAEQITKKQRVKVRFEQLNRWYRPLDALLAAKEQIEEALYLRVRDLFSLKADMVFYDLTSLYFCRRSPKGKLRRHGPSKGGKPRQVQIMLGVVMANGWPIAHHVFAGNTAERTTLVDVLRDLEKRFGLNRVMVVGDRGMVSPFNLDFLSGTPFRYLLGIPGRRCEEAATALNALDDQTWEGVDEGNRVQEANLSLSEAESGRYFVIESQERKAYEEAMRKRSMERARQALEKVAAAVKAGRLKDPTKIGARAQRALSQHHGYRYYSWEVEGRGQFRFFEDADKLQAEMVHEGKYILKTDDAELTAVDAVSAYKELSTLEWGFRDLKDVIEGRPIFHQRDERVEAHVFVATLALFLKRTLDHELAAALPELSSTEAFAAMESIGIAELTFNGQTSRLASGGGQDARRVLAALGIKDIDPPGPRPGPKGAQK